MRPRATKSSDCLGGLSAHVYLIIIFGVVQRNFSCFSRFFFSIPARLSFSLFSQREKGSRCISSPSLVLFAYHDSISICDYYIDPDKQPPLIFFIGIIPAIAVQVLRPRVIRVPTVAVLREEPPRVGLIEQRV